MGAGHSGSLLVAGDSPVHQLAPECKVLATVAFVLAAVSTPREQIWAFGILAAALGAVVARAGLPPGLVLRRLTIELPFVAFALFLPFVASGPRIDLGPLALSIDGLWAGWNVIAKGTLGVAASVVLTSTTPVGDLIRGLQRLRVPAPFTAIASFMVRYGDVITSEMRRMSVARRSRGHDPRWIWQVRAVAHSAGALFVRSYERGERVHLAMLARGYDGTLPVLHHHEPAPRRGWRAALVPLVAVVIMVVARIAA